VFERLDELFDSAELIESVRPVGVTTSRAVYSSGPPSTENCGNSQKLTSGRRAVDETRRERATRSVAVAVVGSSTAVLRRRRWRTGCRRRGRREDALGPLNHRTCILTKDVTCSRLDVSPAGAQWADSLSAINVCRAIVVVSS